MGRFARLAQTVYLLGRVYRHIADRESNTYFNPQESAQLTLTIRALINLANAEGTIRQLEFCVQTAVCYK